MESSTPRYQNFISDNLRWEGFEFREGDIVICTPAKCGTTWTQMICALLIFQEVDFPKPLSVMSPWLDMKLDPKEQIFAELAEQSHRRFIKTHTPLDGIPSDARATYICVGRDPRDAAISMMNHYDNMDFEAISSLMRLAGAPETPEEKSPLKSPSEPETTEEKFWKWVDSSTPASESDNSLLGIFHHFEKALEAQHRPNVAIIHYANLKANLEGEMRRIAAHLKITVPESKWGELVVAAQFESMRARATELAPNVHHHAWRENKKFFHSGTGGHWREFFNEEAQKRYNARVESLTQPEVAHWAHHGSLL